MTEKTKSLYSIIKEIVFIIGFLITVVTLSIKLTQYFDSLSNGQKEMQDLVIKKANQIEEHQRKVEAKLFRDSANAADSDNELKKNVSKIYKLLKIKDNQ